MRVEGDTGEVEKLAGSARIQGERRGNILNVTNAQIASVLIPDACVRRVGDSLEKLRPASRLHFLFKLVGERKQLALGETIRTSEFRLASLEGLSLPEGMFG